MKKDIVLMTTLYEACVDDPQRLFEYRKCLEINLSNTDITQIVVFFELKEKKIKKKEVERERERERERESCSEYNAGEDFVFLNNPKIRLHCIKKRPSFKDFFEYANQHYPQKHIVVCNGDIFFHMDSNIDRITEINTHKELWFLTRYYYHPDLKKWFLNPWGKNDYLYQEGYGFDEFDTVTDVNEYSHLGKNLDDNLLKFKDTVYFGSADSFCFLSPIALNTLEVLGGSHCDSFLMRDAMLSGFTTLNPALSIISRHCHQSSARNYPQDVTQLKNIIDRVIYSLSITPVCSLQNPHYIHKRKIIFMFFLKLKKRIKSRMKYINLFSAF